MMTAQTPKTQQNKTDKHTPLTLYEQRISTGEIMPDPLQRDAVGALDGIHNQIISQKPQSKSGASFWPFGKKKSSTDNQATAKGLYMYGSVGRGKSMVMDLFYECLPDDMPKMRIHFHAFMIRLHDFMHDRRQSGAARTGSTDKALLQFA